MKNQILFQYNTYYSKNKKKALNTKNELREKVNKNKILLKKSDDYKKSIKVSLI